MSAGVGTKIISAEWVVPVATPPIRGGAVCVNEAGRIIAVADAEELLRQRPAAKHDHINGTLLPGLVNAHTHLELSALGAQVPGGDGLVPWVQRLMRANAELTQAARLEAVERAIVSLWQLGTAGIGDVGNRLLAPPMLSTRPLQGSFFHEILGSQDGPGRDALALAREEYDDLVERRHWPENFVYVQAPHAPYSASPELLRRLFQAANTNAQATSIHAAEDAQELALLMRGQGDWTEVLTNLRVDPKTRAPGVSPVPYLKALGAFAGARKPLLVHMCHASGEDIRLAAAEGAPVVLCPRSNLHITGQLANVPALIQAGVTLALGTDSLASNASLSLWEEMATLAEHFPSVPASVWLRAATLGGSQALHRTQLGAFVAGKSPGLIALDITDADPVAAVVHARPAMVNWILEPQLL